ncbi:MAG: primosomal replication protein N [Betaproteobacteria bacterium RIFCSPLOWO2_02_FULL_67_26]|nr:MAG: primosomal replication protein N [Betaproteobacteria bacterium RIFCSPLOWO2_02_FULL_67_26]
MEANEVALTGELATIEPLRYTPAGIPLLAFRLLHRSRQTEAGLKRQVECEMGGVAMADVAVAMARLKPGQAVKLSGFLNRKNRLSTQLILHATAALAIKE